LALVAIAFVAEFFDSSIGMGYGTLLMPLLLLFGFSPLQIVPAVLLSEFVTGTLAGISHHNLGNVNFKRGSRPRRVAALLALCSVVGTVIAVFLAIGLPKNVVTFYIGAMVLAIGLVILLWRKKSSRFSWGRIIGLGTVAAFNKGISGGGYGPLVTGGQLLVGVEEKEAIGITSLAEGAVCLVGLVLYMIFSGLPDMSLAFPLLIGAALSVPVATRMVRIMPANYLRWAIGVTTIFLGSWTLFRLFVRA